jgi:hypothetical protein
MLQRQTKGSLFKISRVSKFSKQNVNKERKSSQEVTTAIKRANTKVWGSLVSYILPKIGKIIYFYTTAIIIDKQFTICRQTV